MPRPKDDNKTDSIYDATLRLVLLHGFSGLKMADVAKEANIATGSLYRYFKNKEDLINQLYLHLKKEKMRELLAGDNPQEPFFLRFKRLWFNYFEACYCSPQRMIFLEQFHRSGIVSQATKDVCDAMLLPLFDFVQQGIQDCFIKDLPPVAILSQMMGASNELVKLHIDRNLPIDSSTRETYFDMAWSSIRR